jgi:hypothetical protein
MRVRPRRSLPPRPFGAFGVWIATLLTCAAPALGQVPEKREAAAPPPTFVFGGVECPDPKTVQQAVLNLIPPERHSLLARGVRVELEDLGDSYRVTVWKDGASVKKSYSDPAHDCDGRARFAAVFAVLTLMPPELGAEPIVEPEPKPEPAKPPPVPPPTPTKPPASAPDPVRPPLVHLELSALYAYAPAILETPSMHSFGGELRAALGRGAFSGTLSVAYLAGAKFDLNDVQGELSRIPVSVGARYRSDFDAWSLSADFGVLLVAERMRATNLLRATSQSAANFGLRAGVQLAREFGPHFAPFVGAFTWFSPAPSEISALPQGVVGNLPYFWFGGAAGVSFGL